VTSPFIGSLPLVASALGRRYGVKVATGCDKASTDGRTIFLPSLPLESDPETINLARGYIDHESAHICETDFDLVKRSALKPVEKHLWNIIEDFRIERIFSERFPGCKANFEWLILRFFDQEIGPSSSPLDEGAGLAFADPQKLVCSQDRAESRADLGGCRA
jgi:hypothetical protein